MSVVLDGEDESQSVVSSTAHFTFYSDMDFAVHRVHPLGGPILGGTFVNVYLSDHRLLVDLGGKQHGPTCRFTYAQPSADRDRVDNQVILVRASLYDCDEMRHCGSGRGSLLCAMPPYTGPLVAGAADVTVEVTINGQDYTRTGRTFRYYDPAAWRVLTFSPHGGPLTGNTSMVLHCELIQSLGDVRCRFGEYPLTSEVNATIHSPSLVRCISPAHWEQRFGSQHAEVQLTLNGQDYLRFGPQSRQFSYYAVDGALGVSIRHLTPNGGPSAGGTLVRVSGTRLADVGGLLCSMTGEPPVAASLDEDTEALWCTTPTVALLRAAFPESRNLEATINGQLVALTSSGVPFHYYERSIFNVSRLFPLGGPLLGGTLVSLYLSDERLLFDLGGTDYGPTCQFTYTEPSADLGRVETRVIRVRANLTNCNGGRQCGAGHASLLCVAPPYLGPLAADAADVTVEVTINGQDYTRTGLTFRYYDPAAWRLNWFWPLGGPLMGNTSMRLRTDRLERLGDVRCRFGPHQMSTEVNATIQNPSLVLCVTPAHWERRYGSQQVEIQVTLNGQDYLRFGHQARQYTFFDFDSITTGLSVLHLSPNGGPSAGGTLVRVSGTGMADLGGTWCQFDESDEVAVPATLIDGSTFLCRSPPSRPDSVFDGSAVELTINGQLHQRTSNGVVFQYYLPEGVRVSRIYPRGGPSAGGTEVTLYGRGFRDLDHGRGLRCAFGGPLVPATVAAGSDEGRLICVTPPIPPSASESRMTCDVHAQRTVVPVRITLNGNNSFEATDGNSSAMTIDVGANVQFTYH